MIWVLFKKKTSSRSRLGSTFGEIAQRGLCTLEIWGVGRPSNELNSKRTFALIINFVSIKLLRNCKLFSIILFLPTNNYRILRGRKFSAQGFLACYPGPTILVYFIFIQTWPFSWNRFMNALDWIVNLLFIHFCHPSIFVDFLRNDIFMSYSRALTALSSNVIEFGGSLWEPIRDNKRREILILN